MRPSLAALLTLALVAALAVSASAGSTDKQRPVHNQAHRWRPFTLRERHPVNEKELFVQDLKHNIGAEIGTLLSLMGIDEEAVPSAKFRALKKRPMFYY